MPPLYRDETPVVEPPPRQTEGRIGYLIDEPGLGAGGVGVGVGVGVGDGQSRSNSSSNTTSRTGFAATGSKSRGKSNTYHHNLVERNNTENDYLLRDDVETTFLTAPISEPPSLRVASTSTAIRNDFVASSIAKNTDAHATNHYDGRRMLQSGLLGMILPLGIVMWFLTHQIVVVLGAMLFLPLLAIAQGSIAIIRYRVKYRDCPLPRAPSHGIVKVVDSRASVYSSSPELLSLEEQRDGLTTTTSSNSNSNNSNSNSNSNRHQPLTRGDGDKPPLRLLVIGDSLAIGVGQSSTATPVMPERIAKSLSKELEGRPVLWTCHGAPGASAGWIVRELERSIQQGQFLRSTTTTYRSTTSTTVPGDDLQTSQSSVNFDMDELRSGAGESRSANNTTSRSSAVRTANSPLESDSTSSSDDSSSTGSDDVDEETQTWQERLRQECIHFDPNTVGPFDIAVVLTGSNDLKSAFFPFLLTGEDAEFRRQAQQHGGGYPKELKRILQVLNQGMRIRLQTMCESVEEVTQKVRERLGSFDGGVPQNNEPSTSTRRRTRPRTSSSSSVQSLSLQEEGLIQEPVEDSTKSNKSPLFPMVVLPGMPSRALPIFAYAPLRWLAVPIVDMMDSHKRKLARQHRGEVLFVDAPSVEAINDYIDETGDYWQQEQEQQDQVLLNLRDIKRKHAARIESAMADYYDDGSCTATSGKSVGKKRPCARNRHFDVFSVDGIHPNDQGYDFWGQHIAHHIVEEWKRKRVDEVV